MGLGSQLAHGWATFIYRAHPANVIEARRVISLATNGALEIACSHDRFNGSWVWLSYAVSGRAVLNVELEQG